MPCGTDPRGKSGRVGLSGKNHLIRNEAEEADKYYHYYSIISEVLQLKLTEDEIVEIARDRTYNVLYMISEKGQFSI